MAESTKVIENIFLKVEEKSKSSREGTFKVKVVKYNGKDYEVGKTSKDKVKAGKEYSFDLSKSEFKDKLYYWANLSQTGNSGPEVDKPENTIWAQLRAMDKEQKIKVIKWLLDRI